MADSPGRTRFRASLCASLCVFVCTGLLAACGGGSSEPPATYRFEGTLSAGGRLRTYTLKLPPDYYTSSIVPLVIALHGGGGSGAQFEASSLLTQKADAAQFAVVYPTGTSSVFGLNTWNGGGCYGSAVTQNVDDVDFIRQLIVELTRTYKIDTKRIYATGHSNGGIMSYRLACELADRIAAVAPNAAELMLPSCTPARPVPVLHMHSRLDTQVPVAGGFGTGVAGVSFPPETTMQRCALTNGCAAAPQVSVVAGAYTHSIWPACGAGTSVELLLTEDGGHAWPGGLPGSSNGDTPSRAISANDRLWTFFQRFALP